MVAGIRDRAAGGSGRGAMTGRGLWGAIILAVVLLIVPGRAGGGEPDGAFPAYGGGAVSVRLYTDYFCPPCRAMEPAVESILDTLLKKKSISLILVDVPFHRHSALYTRYFLYALKESNRWEHARKVRQLLMEAAAGDDIRTKEQLEQLFQRHGISWTVYDPKDVFNRFNKLIREDDVKSTPTCVIIRNGKKEIFVGSRDIPQALKRLP